MTNPDPLSQYTQFDFTFGSWTRKVFRRGNGPAVIVIHEIPGIHPLVVRFADHLVQAGHAVFLPSLLGKPGKPVTRGYVLREVLKGICIRREFSFWASNRSSPISDWLRALARKVHDECGGPGVGAVGMCFSGGFALAMMTEPAVSAPVMSQPSLPLPVGAARRKSVGLSPSELESTRNRLEKEDLTVIGLRFLGDPAVPDERFAAYKECFGNRFEAIEINPADAAPGLGSHPHSVLTINLRDDDPAGPTKRAEMRVIEFFGQRLKGAKPLAATKP